MKTLSITPYRSDFPFIGKDGLQKGSLQPHWKGRYHVLLTNHLDSYLNSYSLTLQPISYNTRKQLDFFETQTILKACDISYGRLQPKGVIKKDGFRFRTF